MERRNLSVPGENMVIGIIQAGARKVDIGEHFSVSQSEVSRLVSRFNQTGNIAERLRTGRPKVSMATQDRYITLSDRIAPLDIC